MIIEIFCYPLQRLFVFMLFLFAFAKAESQQSNTIENETVISGSSFTYIDIQLSQYIDLTITTTESSDFKMISIQNGEYRDAVALSSSLRNDSLIINDPIQASFKFPQDKLGAHKVIDGKATLYIPNNKMLIIQIHSGNLHISGSFKQLLINQLSGSCSIKNIKGDLKLVSVYADVFLHLDDYMVNVKTKTGKISAYPKPQVIKYQAQIETISGNVSMLKMGNK